MLFVQTVLFIRVLTLNYVILEVSPSFPQKFFSQFPPLMGEMGETYIANPDCNSTLFVAGGYNT